MSAPTPFPYACKLILEEHYLQYRPGGFHPVSIGDTFCAKRYVILNKLGFGAFATVWLAKDTQTNRWVAIKIPTADSSSSSRECKVLQELEHYAEEQKTTLRSFHITRLLSHFVHKGPNGSHDCLVFPLLGPSTSTLINHCFFAAQHDDSGQYHDYIRPSTILRMAESLLKAVTFVHKCGFVHGDIRANNIVFTANKLSKLDKKGLFEIIGEPSAEKVTAINGAALMTGQPSQLFKAATWERWDDNDEEDIELIDFGQSFPRADPRPDDVYHTPDYRAPETVLNEDFDWRIDLWSVGITIFFFVFGECPFDDFELSTYIRQLIESIEGLPSEWQSKWDHIRDKEEPASELRKDATPYLDQRFRKLRSESLKLLLPVVKGLLRVRPSDRISAAEALRMVQSGQETIRKEALRKKHENR